MKASGKNLMRTVLMAMFLFLAVSCASVDVPEGKTVHVPPTTPPLDRYEGLNEKRDPVTRVRLGRDVLMPQPAKEGAMPNVHVGPYELRGETLASALQMILDDYDISIAFESNEGLTRRITVSNLHGKLRDVVNRVCALADLYCHYGDNTLTIKNTEMFVVDLPPINVAAAGGGSSSGAKSDAKSEGGGSAGDAYGQIAAGLASVIGSVPTVDSSTRVMVYTATQRSQKYALQYFERLRKNTALIIFETHIWEVTLNSDNRTGINWNALFRTVGTSKFNIGLAIPGGAPVGATKPISITAGAGADLTTQTVLDFLSERGAVKTVSQPQITVLSGSSATMAVSQQDNYVSGSTRTPSTIPGGTDTVSVTTGTVTTGLTMNVTSAWDQSTVYGNLNIALNDLLKIDNFKPDTNTTIQLPKTTTRSLQTEIRVRPGDAILIGGLVSEKNNLAESGPGFMKPLITTSSEASKANTELVFLLRPRVVAFVPGGEDDTVPVTDAPREGTASKAPAENLTSEAKKLFKPAPRKPAKKTSFPVPPSTLFSDKDGKKDGEDKGTETKGTEDKGSNGR